VASKIVATPVLGIPELYLGPKKPTNHSTTRTATIAHSMRFLLFDGSSERTGQRIPCSARPGYFLLSLSDRNRFTVVPHTGQAPLAIGRPFDVLTTLPSLTLRFVRHLTQYPSNSILHPFLFWLLLSLSNTQDCTRLPRSSLSAQVRFPCRRQARSPVGLCPTPPPAA